MYLGMAECRIPFVDHCDLRLDLTRLKINFFGISGAGNDNNHAHPDTSMKLGRNVHWHELLEFFSLANQNWSIFKMAALKSKMAATIIVKS